MKKHNNIFLNITYVFDLFHGIHIVDRYRKESWMKIQKDVHVVLGIGIHENLNWEKY